MMPQHILHRPHYHFTPPQMWMNDPNGLVCYRGNYHLFYQYHPYSDDWGPMHWGHAISDNLIHWQHLPIALWPDEHGMIFSGSIVIDWQNTAGFGREAMVALFTHHKEGHQRQSLAYSLDQGLLWEKYSDNPILHSLDDSDFRDPKVFRHADWWVMCLAARNRILFYSSADLIQWEPRGSFGGGYGVTDGVWETPDLFELIVEDTAETRWILTVSVASGHPAGGSGTQYFIGDFNGRTFISENPIDTILWADFGADYYAPQTWNDEPNGRRLMIGWMSNWQYAHAIPTLGWRGTLSSVRELSLKRTEEGLRLIHQPIAEMQSLRRQNVHWPAQTLTPGKNLLANVEGISFEILAEFQILNTVHQVGFHIRFRGNEWITIGYLAKEKKLFVDRTHSGEVKFHNEFARIHYADLNCRNHRLRLHIFFDQSSIEVFSNDGLVVLTDCIFPTAKNAKLELFVEGDKVMLISMDVFLLSSAQYTFQEALQG